VATGPGAEGWEDSIRRVADARARQVLRVVDRVGQPEVDDLDVVPVLAADRA